MTREKHWKWRGITLDAKRILSYCMSQSSFHFESHTKAYMSSWSHCGTLCVSLYLVRQLAQPLIFQRPQHATDRIMNLSPAGFTGSHSAANTDCAFKQINLQMSRQCNNLSLIVLCVRGGVRQRCNVQRDSSEKGAGVRHRPKGMLAEDHGTGWSEKEIRLKTFITCRLCLSSPIDLFFEYRWALFYQSGMRVQRIQGRWEKWGEGKEIQVVAFDCENEVELYQFTAPKLVVYLYAALIPRCVMTLMYFSLLHVIFTSLCFGFLRPNPKQV